MRINQLPKICWVNFNNSNAPLISGRATPRAAKHGIDDGNDESADEKAVAASMEWIMVRMDLLAYYK